MTKTKKALALSVLSMMLCIVMLIGSTFAWFTDSVTSGNNTIVAGNLDVELEYRDADGNWQKVDENTELFSALETDETADNLWEPGHTEVVYLKVSNVGTLALKYQFAVNVIDETIFTNVLGDTDCKLSDYLVFGQDESDTEIEEYESREDAWTAAGDELGIGSYTKGNDLLKPGEAEYAALIVYMPTTVGNEANYRGDVVPEITFGVTLLATQTPFEEDSFGNDYDEGAEYPVIEKPAASDGSASFAFPGETPTGEEATLVSFPAGSFEPGDVVSLTVSTAEIGEDETDNYPAVTGLAPIGSVELTLLVNGEPQTSFNGKTATVTTYVAAEAEDVSVKYIDGDQAVEEHLESYDAVSGKVVFTTDHFSAFAVYAKPAEAEPEVPEETIATLTTGQKLNTAMKQAYSSSASYDYNNSTIKSVVFGEHSDEYGAWESGTNVGATETDDIRMFVVGGNVYVCVQPNTKIKLNADCTYMFQKLLTLDTVEGLNDCDASEVTTTRYMFYYCSALKTVDFTGWNTESLTNMNAMFYRSGVTNLDLSGFNTSKVENMREMFLMCSSLETLNMDGWDTSNVNTMVSMFEQCSALTELDLSSWNTEEVTTFGYMFSTCRGMTKLNLSGWDTSKVTNMGNMFTSCSKLTELNVSGWNTESVTSFANMFDGCTVLPKLDLSGWNTSAVTTMANMFSYCNALAELDLSGWNVAGVKYMKYMFQNCAALKNIYADKDWSIQSGCDTSYMFSGCSKLPGYSGATLDTIGGAMAKLIENGGYFTNTSDK